MKRFLGLFAVVALIATPALAQVDGLGTLRAIHSIDATTGVVTTYNEGDSQPRFVGDVYNNMFFFGPGTTNAGISSTSPLSTVFGDQVHTLGTGTLDVFGFSTFNSGSGGGNIDQYIVTVKFYL